MSAWQDDLTLSLRPDNTRQQRIVDVVSTLLPPSFSFSGFELHSMVGGGQAYRVALFEAQGARFALIPGGHVTLGYDPATPFVLAPSQRWQSAYPTPDLQELLPTWMTPLRTATLAPFLIETTAHPLQNLGGWDTHQEVVGAIAAQGFRLPTSDEWEYACAAGARTLFRWGDDCPCDRFPTDDMPAPEWMLHRAPNAFGLHIGANPYKWEMVMEPGVRRGGDGGASIHGPTGYFLAWMTLGSAYIERDIDDLIGAHVRRVFPLIQY